MKAKAIGPWEFKETALKLDNEQEDSFREVLSKMNEALKIKRRHGDRPYLSGKWISDSPIDYKVEQKLLEEVKKRGWNHLTFRKDSCGKVFVTLTV